MQLFLPSMENNICLQSPLKYQLLKWVGNKQRYANEIISLFPSDFNVYFEPFLGSGAVLAALAPMNGLGTDNFPPLIEIWKTLKNRPEELKEWYKNRWDILNNGDKIGNYEEIKKSYNNNPNGADLLFYQEAAMEELSGLGRVMATCLLRVGYMSLFRQLHFQSE